MAPNPLTEVYQFLAPTECSVWCLLTGTAEIDG
ncbi:hypothetical protein FOWG_12067 [Fusarium oxysporum f. sp. lycopersici MN25]|uniref:Uncharacterized protein n=1 Tax=Fusarium oxysporum Fo47 TaxID=660027 RepID=W9KW59_FUSOX|nr:hypothetical protein FOZG_02405 [Fusarium oxysporum Fo47]EWZ84254.1 hypothetical protein FOWG_12067 [Fusarium oxysporum f. sp. lycopersici MN25]